MSQQAQRIPYLDGVRGIAILLVFVAHLLDGVSPHNRGLFPWVTQGGGGGLIGVQLFFVLSGFLITSILVREFGKTGTIKLGAFYLRRFWRLFPALLVVCVVAVAFTFIFMRAREFKPTVGSAAMAITYTTNLGTFLPSFPNNGWLSHSWSLSVEEQFYLLWPPILLLCLRKSRALVFPVIIAGILAAVTFRAISGNELLNIVLFRWDAIMVGCLLALWRPRIPRWVTAVGLVIIACYAVHLPIPVRNYDYLLCGLGSGLFLLYAEQSKWVAHPVLIYFGRISYGLYLWHLLIGRVGWPGYVTLLGGIVAAELSYRFIEAPILAWSHRKRPGQADSAIAPAAELEVRRP